MENCVTIFYQPSSLGAIFKMSWRLKAGRRKVIQSNDDLRLQWKRMTRIRKLIWLFMQAEEKEASLTRDLNKTEMKSLLRNISFHILNWNNFSFKTCLIQTFEASCWAWYLLSSLAFICEQGSRDNFLNDAHHYPQSNFKTSEQGREEFVVCRYVSLFNLRAELETGIYSWGKSLNKLCNEVKPENCLTCEALFTDLIGFLFLLFVCIQM